MIPPKNGRPLAALIAEESAELRLKWRQAAHFDDVAVMHITENGERMLRDLAKWLGSGSNAQLRNLINSPPWMRNEQGADSPAALLTSLRSTLDSAFGEPHSIDIEHVAMDISAAIDASKREQVRSLEERASFDSLTGALSRSELLRRLDEESARVLRHGRSLSVVYVDLNDLKKINDESGHAEGDRILRLLVEICADNTRAADSIGRMGGDEFLLVLPETDSAGAENVARKLGAALAESGVSATLGAAGTLDVSAEPEALIAQADAAMRASKVKRHN